MPQKVSQRNAKRYLNSLWLFPSLKPVDQVLSKLSLKKNSMLCYSQWLVLSENPPKQIVRKIPGTVATTPLSHLIPGSTIRMIFSVFLYQTWTASSLPYVVTLMMLILGGQIADYLRKHHLATGTVRKIFNTIGKWLSRYIKKIAKTDLGAGHYLSWGVMEERGGGGEVGDFDCVTLNFSWSFLRPYSIPMVPSPHWLLILPPVYSVSNNWSPTFPPVDHVIPKSFDPSPPPHSDRKKWVVLYLPIFSNICGLRDNLFTFVNLYRSM